jgi:hypothetical protein
VLAIISSKFDKLEGSFPVHQDVRAWYVEV